MAEDTQSVTPTEARLGAIEREHECDGFDDCDTCFVLRRLAITEEQLTDTRTVLTCIRAAIEALQEPGERTG